MRYPCSKLFRWAKLWKKKKMYPTMTNDGEALYFYFFILSPSFPPTFRVQNSLFIKVIIYDYFIHYLISLMTSYELFNYLYQSIKYIIFPEKLILIINQVYEFKFYFSHNKICCEKSNKILLQFQICFYKILHKWILLLVI